MHVGVGVDACDLCVGCGADPDEEPTPPVTVEEVLDIDIESEPPATTSDVRRRVLLHNVLCVDEQGLLADTVSVYPKCCPAAQAVIEREVMQLARLLCDTLGPEAILEPFKKFTEPAIRLVRELFPSPRCSWSCQLTRRRCAVFSVLAGGEGDQCVGGHATELHAAASRGHGTADGGIGGRARRRCAPVVAHPRLLAARRGLCFV